MSHGERQLRAARAVREYIWNHPSNRGRRVSALAAAIAFQARTRILGRRTVTRLGWASHIEVEAGYTPAESCVVYAPLYDFNEMLAWYRHVRPGDLFVDVGAAVGSYALIAAEAGATVIAVEPNAAAAARLRRNAERNGAPIEVYEGALADRSGAHYAQAEQHSVATFAAPVTTLDAILGDRMCAGVKIDVEGGERLVLEGASRALGEKRIALLQLEWNNCSEVLLGEDRAPVAALLRAAGYELCRPDHRGVLRPCDPVDFGPDVFALLVDQPR